MQAWGNLGRTLGHFVARRIPRTRATAKHDFQRRVRRCRDVELSRPDAATVARHSAYRNLAGSRLLAAVFHDPKYIWMRRRNRVEQAVSWAMACQTGVWAKKRGANPKPRAMPRFDFKVIDEWCKRVAEHETAWENYFRENQIEQLVLFYEDVVESKRAAAKCVLEFLGLPFSPTIEIAPSFQKQATPISNKWAAAYLKEKRKKTRKLARILRRIRI